MAAHTSDGQERNNYKISLPADSDEALKWVVQRMSKLLSDRKMTADKILEVKHAARNDGFANETISSSVRLAKMSPEKRTVFVERMNEALRIYGFDAITPADEDATGPRVKLQREHINKIIYLTREKREISEEISTIYATAKDYGIDVPTLKQIVKLSKMDGDDREEWFARIDNMGARLKFWSM